MSEQSVLNTLTTFSFSVQATNEVMDTIPIYRILLDVSYGNSMGYFQSGYYIKLNERLYFIRKKEISIITNSQTERVLEFLKRTQAQFTIDVNNDKTLSGHQYLEINEITYNTRLYTVRDYRVHKSLWQEIERELYESKYSPSIARFTSGRLIWYVELFPEHSLQFTQVTTISLSFVGNQGHLQVFKMPEVYTLPYYFYSQRKKLTFFNHEVKGDMYVIPLGSERRIVKLSEQTTITSPDHDPVVLPAGEYLLFHPRPRPDDAVD